MSNVLHAPCDAATAQARAEAGQTGHPRFVIATTILASSLAFVDGSVVNVGLPAIGASFRADADHLQWVVNAYLLPLSALLLLGGAVGDRFGRRRLLIAGVGLFGVASLACAAAPSLLWLLVARFVQGVSAAMLMPSSLAILGQSFSGEAKGRAIGIWAAVGAAAGAFGPVLGGWLIDAGSWRFVFLINLPLAAAAIVLAYLYVSVDFDGGSDSLDAIGAALVTVGLGLTTWALTEGSGGRGWSLAAFAVLGVGGLFLIAFLLAERRLGDKAMMPLALFGSRSFVGLTDTSGTAFGSDSLPAALTLAAFDITSGEFQDANDPNTAVIRYSIDTLVVPEPSSLSLLALGLFVRTHRKKTLLLNRAKEHCLLVGPQFANFIEKHDAEVGLLEQPGTLRLCASERAAHMTEQR